MSLFDGDVAAGGVRWHVRVERAGAGWVITIDDEAPVAVTLSVDAAGRPALIAGGRMIHGTAVRDGATVRLSVAGVGAVFSRVAPGARVAAAGALGPVVAPMTGTVVAVSVKVGDIVAAHANLVSLEAMKMEHQLTAPAAAVVAAVNVVAGGRVSAGDVVVVLAPVPGAPWGTKP